MSDQVNRRANGFPDPPEPPEPPLPLWWRVFVLALTVLLFLRVVGWA